MSAAAKLIDPLDAFKQCAAVRAMFWSRGQVTLHDAVDGLQAVAERDGLIARIGQDDVQRILHEAFNGARGDHR